MVLPEALSTFVYYSVCVRVHSMASRPNALSHRIIKEMLKAPWNLLYHSVYSYLPKYTQPNIIPVNSVTINNLMFNTACACERTSALTHRMQYLT